MSPSHNVGQVLAVVSQKGGVGKTTTAVNIAASLARRGNTVLLVDADPQGSVRFGLGLSAAATHLGLSDYLAGTAEMHKVVRTTTLPWLRVVSAGSVTDKSQARRATSASSPSRRVRANCSSERGLRGAHRNRGHAAGSRSRGPPRTRVQSGTCSFRSSASRWPCRPRHRSCGEFARRWLRIPAWRSRASC